MSDLPTSTDALVIGAGPAGSAAAATLARAGHRTLLLDRADFPRDKPCGDLIGVHAMRLARSLGVDETVLSPFSPLAGALVTSGGGTVDLTPRGPLGRRLLRGSDARVVPRLLFDAALVTAATRAGAQFHRATVRSIGPWDDHARTVVLSTTSGPTSVAAQLVVLAGGYGSRVLLPDHERPVEAPDAAPHGIALRGYVSSVALPPDRIAFCLDDWVLPGYGWVFPLPDGRANVGVGTLVRPGVDRERLRSLYDRFVSDPASPAFPWLSAATAEAAPRSWPLDLAPRPMPLAHDGLLLAGESAALVGPLTGAGIAFALATGVAAGRHADSALSTGNVSTPSLAPYEHEVRRRFSRWLRAEASAQRFLSSPTRVRRLIRTVRPLPPTGALGARLLLHLG